MLVVWRTTLRESPRSIHRLDAGQTASTSASRPFSISRLMSTEPRYFSSTRIPAWAAYRWRIGSKSLFSDPERRVRETGAEGRETSEFPDGWPQEANNKQRSGNQTLE